ncbi:MAG: DUF3298 domain-containing protein [Bacteroidaceae bacterium]|nr:DUF3298 domain-containing protein [Bacteroidaceae bacterium]
MKRKSITVWALTVALVCLLVTGCKSGCSEITDDNKTVERTEGQDSVFMNIDFPQCGNKLLQTAIVEYISETLGGTYEGDYADTDSLMAHYASEYMADMREIRSEFLDDVPMEFYREATVNKVYETDKVVTYVFSTEEYSGGAHGIGSVSGVTFRKSDGRRVGLDMLRECDLSEEVKEGLMEYFEVKTDKELEENLMGVDADLIPMPETRPYFMDGGLVFVYQSYEIACYAAGRPSFTIPYEKLRPMLNVTGRRLFSE